MLIFQIIGVARLLMAQKITRNIEKQKQYILLDTSCPDNFVEFLGRSMVRYYIATSLLEFDWMGPSEPNTFVVLNQTKQ